MDRQYVSNTGMDRLTDNRPHQSSPLTVTYSCSAETETLIPGPSELFGSDRNFESDKNTDNENNGQEQKQSFSRTFQHSCFITEENSMEKCASCQSRSCSSEDHCPSSVTPPTVSPSQSQESFKCSSETETDVLQVTIEELG